MTELPSSTNYLPDEVTYGFVADRIILSVGDTRYDSDRFPDGVPANGVVRFIPARTQFYTKEEPATILPQEIRCTIYNRNHPVAIENGYDSNLAGKLVDPAGHVGNVALVVGRYHVTYQLDMGQPHRVTIDVKTTHTNKKPLWIPAEAELKPLPQERFIVNERVYRETAEARDETVEAAEEAAEALGLIIPARDQTLAARDATLAHGITVDTSVGTRVFVGDTMIYGDTGWRKISEWDDNGSITGETLSAAFRPLEGYPGGIYVRRIDSYVWLRIGALERVSTSPASVFDSYTFPQGFRPDNDDIFNLRVDSSNWQGLMFRYTGALQRATGVLNGVNGLTAHQNGINLQSIAQGSWPTTLPGTPM